MSYLASRTRSGPLLCLYRSLCKSLLHGLTAGKVEPRILHPISCLEPAVTLLIDPATSTQPARRRTGARPAGIYYQAHETVSRTAEDATSPTGPRPYSACPEKGLCRGSSGLDA